MDRTLDDCTAKSFDMFVICRLRRLTITTVATRVMVRTVPRLATMTTVSMSLVSDPGMVLSLICDDPVDVVSDNLNGGWGEARDPGLFDGRDVMVRRMNCVDSSLVDGRDGMV